ncbi:MAG: hypothetical protein ABIG93_04510 [archaeon]|nr:hypothetical protein [Nanoarchaeota archaeon]
MSLLKSKRLLVVAAQKRQNIRENVSKKEIRHKIEEIKYLASQKRVPKLSLRKEIIHLENKLENVFEIETKLLKAERKESVKIGSLKRQISMLKDRLEHSQDDELRRKVARLTNLLGDTLAKSQSKHDVKLSKEIISVMKDVQRKKEQVEENDINIVRRVEMILNRVKVMENEIEILKRLEKGDPKKLNTVYQSLLVLQKKLEDYKQKHPKIFEMVEKGEVEGDIKHSILFTAEDSEPEGAGPGVKAQSYGQTMPMTPSEHFAQQHIEIVDDEALEEEITGELPLPPPPKIRKKGK